MSRVLGRYSEPAYALMRVVVGLLFACHGAQKLFGVLGGQPSSRTRSSSRRASSSSWGAASWRWGFGPPGPPSSRAARWRSRTSWSTRRGGFWPIVNKGELAVVYCFVFLYIASRGSGSLSVDALMGKGRRA